MTTKAKTQEFIATLLAQGLCNQDIAILASVPEAEVEKLRNRPAREKLAPVYGSLFSASEQPTTRFEEGLKAAGLFATVTNVLDSIHLLRELLRQARSAGDVAAEFAVVQRATQLYFRARSCRGDPKTIQVEALRRFIDYAVGLEKPQ